VQDVRLNFFRHRGQKKRPAEGRTLVYWQWGQYGERPKAALLTIARHLASDGTWSSMDIGTGG
jgi:hypothetical protein